MRGMLRRAVGIGAILTLAAAVAVWRLIPGASVAPAAAQAPPPAIPVTAGTVAVADVPVFLNGIGAVQAYNMVTIKSRVDGQIVKINFTEGQEVKAGTPLVEIDPRQFQAALDQASAARAKDEAQLASAQLDLDRYSKLVGRGYQTQQSYDQQKATVAQIEAAIKGDEAAIGTARLNLGYAEIRAPIDGRLGARLVDAGNLVHAADNAGLVTITQLKPIFVSFTLAQQYLEDIRGAKAKGEVVTQAYSGDGLHRLADGKLTLIDNTVDPATGTIRLKATYDNEDERLWPGEFVNVRLIVSMWRGVATVPAQTVQVGPDGHYAYVIKSDDSVERRPVEVASVQDGIAVVTKGLANGERVVVDGQYRLTEGARVKISTPSG
jgi:membrane fusion protein, multidrug efflux system